MNKHTKIWVYSFHLSPRSSSMVYFLLFPWPCGSRILVFCKTVWSINQASPTIVYLTYHSYCKTWAEESMSRRGRWSRSEEKRRLGDWEIRSCWVKLRSLVMWYNNSLVNSALWNHHQPHWSLQLIIFIWDYAYSLLLWSEHCEAICMSIVIIPILQSKTWQRKNAVKFSQNSSITIYTAVNMEARWKMKKSFPENIMAH